MGQEEWDVNTYEAEVIHQHMSDPSKDDLLLTTRCSPSRIKNRWNVGTEHSNHIRTLEQIIGTTLELWEISSEHWMNVGTYTRMLDCRWTQCYWTSLVTFEQHSKPLQSVEIKSVKNSSHSHPRHGLLSQEVDRSCLSRRPKRESIFTSVQISHFPMSTRRCFFL